MIDWTEERIATLKRGLAEGLTYAAIAEAIGEGCTRSAAIGKAGRLGLVEAMGRSPGRQDRVAPRRGTGEARPAKASSSRVAPSVRAAGCGGVGGVLLADVAPSAEMQVRFLDRRPLQCAAIVDDAAPILERMVCGAPVVGCGGWCAHHRRLFFTRSAASAEAVAAERAPRRFGPAGGRVAALRAWG